MDRPENTDAAPAPRSPAIFGDWTVAAHECPNVCALSAAESRRWLGRKFEIAPSFVASGSSRCSQAVIDATKLTAREFHEQFRFEPSAVGLRGPELWSYEVRCAGEPWDEPGSAYIGDGHVLFAYWDGVFFRLER